jgi:F-type H+-transporting ATPase subunit b
MEGLFNPLTIVLHTANALLLLVVLYFLLYKPVRKFLRAREESIGARLDEAERAGRDLQAAREATEKQKADAGREVAGILGDGQQMLKTQREQMLEAAKAEAGKILEGAKAEAEALLNGACGAMQEQATELALQIAADTKQHLKFEMAAVDVALCGEGFCGRDHLFVVRGEAVVDGALQQHVAELYVVGVDVGFFGECDFGRLFVRAFAEANANALGDELLDIGLRSEQIRLDDDADGAAPQAAMPRGTGTERSRR